MPEREGYISKKIRKIVDKGAEFSKKIDKILIAAGAGIYILVNSALGAAIIIGSAVTIIPANEIQKWAKKGRSNK